MRRNRSDEGPVNLPSDLQSGLSTFVVANANRFVDARQKNLAIANSAGAGSGEDGLDGASAMASVTTTSSLILGSTSTAYSRPR